jgi:uncharacterized RDD family membrane protein YckC
MAGSGDDDDVWAVAVAPTGKAQLVVPATTTSSTTTTASSRTPTASSATSATTAPTLPPHDAALFRLHLGKWSEVDVLPAGIRRDEIRAVSLMAFEHRLMLAVASGLEVRVYARGGGADDHWDAGTQVAVLSEGGSIQLLNAGGRPVLWMSDPTARTGTLFVRGEQRWSGPVKLQPSATLANYDRRALVVALGRMRMLASDPRGRLAEQFYKLDGSLDGEPSEAVTIPRDNDERLSEFLQILIVVVLVVWFVGSYQQRPALREAVARAGELHLAPLGRRLLGGLIDVIPLIAGFVVADHWRPIAVRLTIDSPEFAFLAAGLGTYLMLATVMELLLGRSIGKLIAGTRIASLDGRRPLASAILIRNLLRVADLAVFPLGFIVLSPLRQRLGDMAAGTIVVRADAPEPPPKDPERSTDADT